MSSPTVSVILPVYNGENYLRCAIDSVLGQTLRDFELLVIDDGSKDSSPAIVASYGERVRYVRQENAGVGAAFNHGLRLARGRYVSWLSHDDVFLPEKLEAQARALARLGRPGVCYTDIEFIDARGVVTEGRELPEHAPGEVLRNLVVAGPVAYAAYSLFYDRVCVEEVGHYDASLRHTQDADMLIRLARKFPFVRVPRKLMRVRRHGEMGSASRAWEQEAGRFYRALADRLSLGELFPELGAGASAAERARARVWMGDRYASTSMRVFDGAAARQYFEALRESPAALPSAGPKLAAALAGPVVRFVKGHGQFYRVGVRSAATRLYGRMRRREG